jgi:putative IMPACT (imprinted ancient) family translation regulator
MTMKRERSPSPNDVSEIYRSSTRKEQTSVFIGAFSPGLSAQALQKLPEFKTATHKIAAWRKRSRQKSLTPDSRILYDQGHDDDGEKWAGKHLSDVLRDTQAEGVVVVARWYGGQNIGPVRFTHIEECAKEAILKWKTEQTVKKQKVDDEAKQKTLVNNLQKRDYNIFALRKLLAEKKAKLEKAQPVSPTAQKPQAYEKMSLEALARVSKARDATIDFILKQIDAVNKELDSVGAQEDDTQGDDTQPGGTQEDGKDEARSTPE